MSTMNRALVIALNSAVVFAIAPFGNGQAQKPKISGQPGGAFASKSKRVQLVAVVNRDRKTGALILTWSLKNISKVDIHLTDNNLFRNYKITVSDRFGNPIPQTRRGQDELTGSYFISHREAFDLHPGEEKTKEIEIAAYYEVKPSGLYTIAVERQIKTENGKGIEKAQSKNIKFKF